MLLFAFACLPTSIPPSPSEPVPVARRVLFVGNSYVYVNDLPALYQGLAAEAGRSVEVQTIASGGYLLQQHAADAATTGSALNAALQQPWDVVVLQEQSQTRGFEGALLQASVDAASQLSERTGDASVVLFQTWGRRDGDPSNAARFPDFTTMQDRLDEGFALHPGPVVPVGEAWRRVHRSSPATFAGLYGPDGSHPSPMGTWLAALVFLGELDGVAPAGVDGPSGADPAVVTELKRAAAEALQSSRF